LTVAGEDLEVGPGLVIPAAELHESASRAGGPGGQHVNKSNTRVSLRWSVAGSPSLAPEQRERLLDALRGRLTREGELVVSSGAARSRARNREAARSQLAKLIASALAEPAARTPTRPTRASQRRRLDEKSQRARLKQQRAQRDDD
jgi:ribosome-associated protein